MARRTIAWAVVLVGCAHAPPPESPAPAPPVKKVRKELASVEVVYRDDKPFAKRGDEEWALGVDKSEMRFSPDQRRFAVIRPPSEKAATPVHRIVVRNVDGNPVNDFPCYRAGVPEDLAWLDLHRIGYLEPAVPEMKLPAVYVVHDVTTGEVLQARSGAGFVWGPERHHVAFVAGAGDKQAVVVDGKNVWPRHGTARVREAPVWSPDGHGLALVADGGPTQVAAAKLIVLVEYDDPHGDLTWPVPKDALSPGLRIFWAGDSKVVIGETALRPRFAAGWERLR